MYIHLDFESDEPIYAQLKHQIIVGIAKKELSPGDHLPSVRSLAADIGINLHTVNKAYQQLKQEGYVQIHRQKGVVVNPNGFPQADESYREQLKKTLQPLVAASVCRGMSKEEFLALFHELYTEFEKKGDS